MIVKYLIQVVTYLLAIQHANANSYNCADSLCSTGDSLGSTVYSVPEYIRAGVHPGLYMVKTGIRDDQDLQRRIISTNTRIRSYTALQRAIEEAKQYDEPTTSPFLKFVKKISKTYEIDQQHVESEPADRMAHDKAWDWAEKNILNNDKRLENYSPEEYLTMFNALHILLNQATYSSDLTHITKVRVPLRTENVIILKDPGFAGFRDPVRGRRYLQQHFPEDVATFDRINLKVNRYITQHSNSRIGDDIYFHLKKTASFSEKVFLDKYFSLGIDPKQLPKALRNLAFRLPKLIKEDPIKAASYAHMRFVKLHPYEDGNGREARMLMNCILAQNGHQMVNIYRNTEYTQVVHEALDKDNFTVFENYLRHTLLQQQHALAEQLQMASKIASCEQDCQDVFDQEFNLVEAKGLKV